MNSLNEVRHFSKEENPDSLARALDFLFAFKFVLEIRSSNFTLLSISIPKSFILFLGHILSLHFLTHTCSCFVSETIK